MSATPVIPIRVVAETPHRSQYLVTGPRLPILFLAALPAAVVALSSEGHAHKRAFDLARTLEGVSRIDDNIKIVPAPSP
jgi:hypothetical protein